MALASSRVFPLPTRKDAATAAYFYAVVEEQLRDSGKPLHAATPEYAYFLNHQPVEVEGSGFQYRAEARLPGMETVLGRLETGAYGLVVEIPTKWPRGEFREALDREYHSRLACRLGFFYGQYVYYVDFPAEQRPFFRIPEDVRCEALP